MAPLTSAAPDAAPPPASAAHALVIATTASIAAHRSCRDQRIKVSAADGRQAKRGRLTAGTRVDQLRHR